MAWGLCAECGHIHVLGETDLQRDRPCNCKGKVLQVSRYVGRTIAASGLFPFKQPIPTAQEGCQLCQRVKDLADRQQRNRRHSAELWDKARTTIEQSAELAKSRPTRLEERPVEVFSSNGR